ncbi:hypothetical protein FH972_005116 [Carpinus fangiana]|uniref:Uncharacterized protein n=1 Tax=Carpinus fangiana TaxID=176857 RepID=A0A5N6QN93_9ROSI|nr:hypothetical protein FH972_005116 [Carpinus fangiana]
MYHESPFLLQWQQGPCLSILGTRSGLGNGRLGFSAWLGLGMINSYLLDLFGDKWDLVLRAGRSYGMLCDQASKLLYIPNFFCEFRRINKIASLTLVHAPKVVGFYGTYDEKTHGRWVLDDPKIGIGIRHVYGIFYASKTFDDARKGEGGCSVLWGWIGESDSEKANINGRSPTFPFETALEMLGTAAIGPSLKMVFLLLLSNMYRKEEEGLVRAAHTEVF